MILWACSNNLGWATKVASLFGSGFGLFLIFFGIFLFISGNIIGGMWMAIIGLFLKRAASSTQTQFYVSKELQGEKVARFMSTPPITVPSNITLQAFIDQYVYKSYHHLYPVTENGKLLGTISLGEVKSVPANEWAHVLVSKMMVPRSKLQAVSPGMNAYEALNLMQSEDIPTLLVAEGDQLVGILTSQDLFKLIALKLELEQGESL